LAKTTPPHDVEDSGAGAVGSIRILERVSSDIGGERDRDRQLPVLAGGADGDHYFCALHPKMQGKVVVTRA
jgi:hypothetical protein